MPWKAEFTGWGFEWRSRTTVAGWPLVHVAFGRRPDGKLRVAKGVIAIGQFAIGAVTLAQFGVGFVFGLGQFVAGAVAVAQMALGLFVALGQVAAALVAVGQVVLAGYGFCQTGFALHLWSSGAADPEAVRFFCDRILELGLPWTPDPCASAPGALEMR